MNRNKYLYYLTGAGFMEQRSENDQISHYQKTAYFLSNLWSSLSIPILGELNKEGGCNHRQMLQC